MERMTDPPQPPEQPQTPQTPQEPQLRTRTDRQNVRQYAVAAETASAPKAAGPDNRQTGIPKRRRFQYSGFQLPAFQLRRYLRNAIATGTTLAVVLALLVVIAAAFWRNDMRAALPQIDGELHVAGLAAPVTVARDANGVPTITAASQNDLLFAQGFVTAQDRLWQMDALRRHAAGRLAEILGPSLVSHDKLERTLQLGPAADRALAQLPTNQRAQLDRYAAGVNAFLTQQAGSLPVEFHILHYTPEPWSARDSLLCELVMFQDLSTEYPAKLARESLSAHLPASLLPDLYPVGSWRDHPPGQSTPDLTSPRPPLELAPLDESQSLLVKPQIKAHDLQQMDAAMLLPHCTDCISGSNEWAVSGAHTASGGPMVSNDMHLGLSVPDIWYEAVLQVGDGSFRAEGVTLPGAPWVIVGRNQHVAWGFTAQLADTQDVYIEHLRGSGADAEYERADGTWTPLQHDREHIVVRGGRNITLDIPMTEHAVGSRMVPTPVISNLYPSARRTLSLLWTAYDPANLSEPFGTVDSATSGNAIVAALSSWGGPSLSLAWADDAQHIGFHAIGRVPIRGPAVPHATGTVPLDTPEANPDSVPAAVPKDEEEANPQQSSLNSPHVQDALHGRPSQPSQPSQPGDAVAMATVTAATAAPHLMMASYISSPQSRTRPHTAERVGSPALPARRPLRSRQRRQAATPPTPEDTTGFVGAEAGLAAGSSSTGVLIGSPIPPTPIDTLDPAGVWSSYIPYDAMPSVIDPPGGLLATANSRITPDGYPYRIAIDWIAPYRVERILHLLAQRTNITPADMLATQMDIHSEFDLTLAQRLAYALDHATLTHDKARLQQAADILRQWNGNVTRDAVAPNIVNATRAALLPMLLEAQIAAHDHISASRAVHLARLYNWNEQGIVLEQILAHQPARWLPPDQRNWNDFLADAVLQGLLQAHAPVDLAHFPWQRSHYVELDHPLLSMSPLFAKLLGVATGTGPHALGGDGTTVKQTGTDFGPSQRFTADMGSGATTMNLTTGQSGNPASRWYLDQFPLWLHGETLAMEAPAQHTLRLLP